MLNDDNKIKALLEDYSFLKSVGELDLNKIVDEEEYDWDSD